MDCRKWLLLGLLVVVVGQGNAAIITRYIEGTNISGSFAYDETTETIGYGPPIGSIGGFKQYELTDFQFTYNDGVINQSWNLSHVVEGRLGDLRASHSAGGTWAVINIIGDAEWTSSFFENSSDNTLVLAAGIIEDENWGTSASIYNADWDFVGGDFYSTSEVPLPAAAWLFLTSLAVLAIGRGVRRERVGGLA